MKGLSKTVISPDLIFNKKPLKAVLFLIVCWTKGDFISRFGIPG